MNKYKKRVLKNGLTVYLFNDNKKNRTTGTVVTLAGGSNNQFIYDGIEYNQVRGVAHFLEHYLLEKSIYGNVIDDFNLNYINTNGFTYLSRTEFYISTVHDFEENFIKLLNVVNNPKFDEKEIDDVKNPIIREIKQSKDNPNYEFNKYITECLLNETRFDIILGEEEDILNMAIDDIKTFYEAFYRPSNQVIFISGKFDEDNIIKLIEKEYKKFNFTNGELIKHEIKEDLSIPCKMGEYIDKDKQEYLNIRYKIDTSSFTPMEKRLLDFFVDYVLSNNVSEKSGFYSVIRKKDLSLYSMGYSYSFLPDTNVFIIDLALNTSKFDESIELITDKMKNLKTNKKTFNKYINNVLIDYINATESIHTISSILMRNLWDYDLEYLESFEDLKKFTYEQGLELFKRLDLSNYCIVKRIKGE